MDKKRISFVGIIVLKILGETFALNLHHIFTTEELAYTFGAESQDQVPAYTATNIHGPLKIGKQAGSSPLSSQLLFDAFNKSFQLNVSLNENLVAPSHVTEFVDANGKITKVLGVQGEFSYGTVLGDPLSRVALHHSGRGLSGMIRTSDELYVITPLPHRIKEVNAQDHVIYRASDNPDDQYVKKIKATEKEVSNVIESHKRAIRNRRSIVKNLPKKTIEILIVGDWKMLEFYGKEFLPTYLLVLVNMMQAIFHDPTMLYPVDLAVVRTQIFETDMLKGRNLHHLLNQFGAWCNAHNNFNDAAPDHFDTGLLVTRNGCSEGCGIVGLANFGVACNAYRSHGVGVDKGFMTASILAHELGHVLGVAHDGGNRCPDAINIMGSGGNYGGPSALRYSVCSIETIDRTMRNPRKSSCFNDDPPTNLLENVNGILLYGTVHSADKQCEYNFDRNYQRCIYKEDSCSAMACNYKGTRSCVTKFFPALHGTPCGDGKWCIDAKCVPNGRPMKMKPLKRKLNGGWSPWSDFTTCNKPCNVGMRWKTRICNSPKPANGGRLCIGLNGKDTNEEEKGHFETCNKQPCPGGEKLADTWIPERDRQCDSVTKGKVFCSYCPVSLSPCGMWCGTRTRGTLRGKVSSGTYCKYKARDGICVNGQCQTIGCDNLLHSGNRMDRCKICGGDGSTCGIVNGFAAANFTKQGRYGTFFVTTIPSGATDLKIEEPGGTRNFLQIKIGSRSSSALWKVFTRYYSTSIAGVKLTYVMKYIRADRTFQDKISLDGTLTQPLHIFYYNNYYYWTSKGVRWTYAMNDKEPSKTPVPSDWEVREFDECSKTCAGGLKRRIIECKRKDDNTQTGLDTCRKANKNEPEATQICNTQDCPGTWDITAWNKCTLTCATGTQTRRIRCMALGVKGLREVNDSKCQDPKPNIDIKRKCNDVSCIAYWDCLKNKVVCKRLGRESKLLIEPDLECLAIYKMKPDDSVKCGKDGGDLAEPYEWRRQRQACAVGCGKGTNIIEVSCHQTKTDEKTSYKNCNNIHPPSEDCGPRACGSVSEDMPDIHPIGCFKDNPRKRTVPEFVKSLKALFNKSDPLPAIRQCADAAREKGYSIFALQSYGDCYIGNDDTLETYDSGGKSTICSSGSGGVGSNFVFKLGEPILAKNLPAVVNVGCLASSNTSTKISGALLSNLLDRLVPYCGSNAYKAHHEYFGIDIDGNCLAKETIYKAMDSKQFSKTCGPESAGISQYHVFAFIDINSLF